MKKRNRFPLLVAGLALALTIAAFTSYPVDHSTQTAATTLTARSREIPAFVARGLDWLAAAQFDNGGWGAGSHANQQMRDPHAVQVDPATTAFSAMALLRSGSTLTDGPYHDNVRRALDLLLDMVETYPSEGSKITDISGTQPQVKLGQNIDVAMTAQFLTQVLPHTKHDKALRNRVGDALETCVTKLSRAQDADGSWNSQGGWAGVLQSAMANNALEMADGAGLKVDRDALERSRRYQQNNIDASSGAVRTESAAGVSLYSIASAQRATAREAQALDELVVEAEADGRLKDATVSEESLEQLGYEKEEAKRLAEVHRQNKAATDMLRDDDVLTGFGNNGGEEFLSYMMTSESLAEAGGEAWDEWYQKMNTRLSKIQNNDGSWSGHHCITSPVFCTAAVIMTMMPA